MIEVMNEDFERIEKQLKEESGEKTKKPIKKSGRSVFMIKRIIEEKAKALKGEKQNE